MERSRNMVPTEIQVSEMPFYATGRESYPLIRTASEEEAGLITKLMTWCATHAGSGGYIPGCLVWDKKTWLKEAGIERKIFHKYLGKSAAFSAQNGGVRVHAYDAQREAQALRTSEKNRKAALSRHAKRGHAMADAMGNATAGQKERETDIEIERGGREQRASAPAAPPTLSDEDARAIGTPEFGAWLDALRGAIPPLERLEALPQDSRAAAAAAFRAAPWAGEPGIAEALRRYYAARRDTLARFGVRDYRPRGVRSIFQGLHDIAAYAGEFCERQDPELKKLEAARRRKAEQLEAERQREEGEAATEEDWEEFRKAGGPWSGAAQSDKH